MAENYTIKAVKKDPKEWESKYGPMKTWLIQVEGNGEPVQLNKKAESPAPEVGEPLYGTITETEYGQKFKSERLPYTGGGGGKSYQPRDDEAIKAQWAIGQAVQLYVTQRDEINATLKDTGQMMSDMEYVEGQAKELFAMIDRVKESKSWEK